MMFVSWRKVLRAWSPRERESIGEVIIPFANALAPIVNSFVLPVAEISRGSLGDGATSDSEINVACRALLINSRGHIVKVRTSVHVDAAIRACRSNCRLPLDPILGYLSSRLRERRSAAEARDDHFHTRTERSAEVLEE